MPKNRLLEIAHHEAAHAVFHLKLGLRCGRVTITPTPAHLGHAGLKRPRWINDQPGTTGQELRLRVHAESEILALCEGRITEEKYAGSRIRWGYELDYAQIADLVSSFISHWADVQSAFPKYCEKQTKLCKAPGLLFLGVGAGGPPTLAEFGLAVPTRIVRRCELLMRYHSAKPSSLAGKSRPAIRVGAPRGRARLHARRADVAQRGVWKFSIQTRESLRNIAPAL